MISLGTTSDIFVAMLLALSQIIEPVPESAVKAAERSISENSTCISYQALQKEYEEKDCESLRDNRRKYRSQCQGIANEMSQLEVACQTEDTIPRVLKFKPKPLSEYLNFSNQALVEELHLICSALQDRAFLERDQWMAGQTANRDDLGSKLVIFQQPEMQDVMNEMIKEAQDGSFDMNALYQTTMALCHWKVDRKAVAEKIDFTGGLQFLRELMAELPEVDKLPELLQASFVYDDQGQRIGEIYEQEFVTRNGKRLLKNVHRRRLVRPSDIPDMLFNSFVAIEDRRFYEHVGFDFEAIKRMLYGGVQSGAQGGSTFTMQLVKNAFFDDDVEFERAQGRRTLRRKIKEILMIPMVESTYTKKEILTYYLNLIDLTPDAQGVLMASIDLFGKENLFDLELEEMALLAALPKGTSRYNPRRNPERAKLRRDTVIRVLEEQGYISIAEKESAQNKPMKLAPVEDRARIMARYFTGHLTNYFSSIRSKKTRDPRWSKGGFDIRTAFNLKLQEVVSRSLIEGLIHYEKTTTKPGTSRSRYEWSPWINEETGENLSIENQVTGEEPVSIEVALTNLRVAHPYPETNWMIAAKHPDGQGWALEDGRSVSVQGTDLNRYRQLRKFDVVLLEERDEGQFYLASGTKVQGAAVVMDIETGEVLALSGGFSAGPYGRFAQNNRATRSIRQVGSTIKPFVYLHALNRGIQPNQSLSNYSVRFPRIDDCPYNWSPSNYSDGGPSRMSLRNALENSVNRSLMNLFVDVSGVPYNPRSSNDLSSIPLEDRGRMANTLYEIYDLAAELGAYPERSSLKDLKRQPVCFPFLLGGNETTPLHMAQGIAAIANGGLRREAIFLKEVLKDGMPLVVDRTSEKWTQVRQYRNALKKGLVHAPEAFGAVAGLDPVAVAQLRSILQGTLERGTATRMKEWSHLIGGKTGTTNNSQDAWFIGFNNKIAVAVWVGYDRSTKELPNLGDKRTGGSVAVPIFQSILKGYYELYPEELNNPLPLPTEVPGVVPLKVDPYSGRAYPAGSDQSCKLAPSSSIVEYFSVKHSEYSSENSCLQN